MIGIDHADHGNPELGGEGDVAAGDPHQLRVVVELELRLRIAVRTYGGVLAVAAALVAGEGHVLRIDHAIS